MSNRTYICVECQTAKRAEAAGGLKTDLRCSSCGGVLWELSQKWRIPKKTDKKAWKELAEIVAQSRPSRDAFIEQRGKDKLAKIDQQIEAFSARKPSEQRDEILKDLGHERDQILRKYFEGGSSLSWLHPPAKPTANKASLLTPDPPPVPPVMTATTSTPSRSLAPGQA